MLIQSHLSDLSLGMRRVTGTPWIADLRRCTVPVVTILGACQKERDLWGRESSFFCDGSVDQARNTWSPETALLLVSIKSPDLWVFWVGPTPKVFDSRTSCEIWLIWFAQNTRRTLCACSGHRGDPEKLTAVCAYWISGLITNQTKGGYEHYVQIFSNFIKIWWYRLISSW